MNHFEESANRYLLIFLTSFWSGKRSNLYFTRKECTLNSWQNFKNLENVWELMLGLSTCLLCKLPSIQWVWEKKTKSTSWYALLLCTSTFWLWNSNAQEHEWSKFCGSPAGYGFFLLRSSQPFTNHSFDWCWTALKQTSSSWIGTAK